MCIDVRLVLASAVLVSEVASVFVFALITLKVLLPVGSALVCAAGELLLVFVINE